MQVIKARRALLSGNEAKSGPGAQNAQMSAKGGERVVAETIKSSRRRNYP